MSENDTVAVVRLIMKRVAEHIDNPSPTDMRQVQGYQDGILDALAILSEFVPLPEPTRRKRVRRAQIYRRINQILINSSRK